MALSQFSGRGVGMELGRLHELRRFQISQGDEAGRAQTQGGERCTERTFWRLTQDSS